MLIAIVIEIVISTSLIGIGTTTWMLLAIVAAMPTVMVMSIAEKLAKSLSTIKAILIEAALGKLITAYLSKLDNFNKIKNLIRFDNLFVFYDLIKIDNLTNVDNITKTK